jgi:hypothetical protein
VNRSKPCLSDLERWVNGLNLEHVLRDVRREGISLVGACEGLIDV